LSIANDKGRRASDAIRLLRPHAQAALFHDAAVGAYASMSSLLTLLATVELLSSWAATSTGSEPARPVRRRLAFAALAGEDWGYLGSTSLVRALKEGKEEVGGVKLDRLELVLELGALGLAAAPKEDHNAPTTLYLHSQKRYANVPNSAVNTTDRPRAA
jgi:nicastrin